MAMVNLAPDREIIRAAETWKQKWVTDPRDLDASDPLHQQPPENEANINWDHKAYRHEWARNGQPVARPLTSGGLVFNEQSQWWERGGISWQPEKKTEGGRQTVVDVRLLGVVVQPTASRLFGKAKQLLRRRKGVQDAAELFKRDLSGVPIVISEVSDPEVAANAKIDLEARSHVLYSHKPPFQITKFFSRRGCRHPSTCTLHPHVNMDEPLDISIPFVGEPSKILAEESGFPLSSCQHEGHRCLSHEQDPCFSHAKGEGKALQIQEDALEQVLGLAATGTEAEKLERTWQQEEEQQQRQDMLMGYSNRKENRPVSAHTLFQHAAKNLQNLSQSAFKESKLRGGSGGVGLKDWFSGRRSSGNIRVRSRPNNALWSFLLGRFRKRPGDLSEHELGGGRHDGRPIHQTADLRDFAFNEDQWIYVSGTEYGRPGAFLDNPQRVCRHSQLARHPYRQLYGCEHMSTQGSFRSRQDDSDSDSSYEFDVEETVNHALGRVSARQWSARMADANASERPDYDTGMVAIRASEAEFPPHVRGRLYAGDGPPRNDDPRTQAEWVQWDRHGRRTYMEANIVTRTPAGRCGDNDAGYDIENRRPGY